jgi:UDP-glucose 4-epimerase
MEREWSYTEFYPGRKIMVTGGLGFIGSNLARRLVDLGSVVLLVDAMIPDLGGNWFNVVDIRDRVEVAVVDVTDSVAMERLVSGQDVIFSLAGQVSHIDSMRHPLSDQDLNCRGPLSLLEACRHRNPEVKVVYASTRCTAAPPRYRSTRDTTSRPRT